MIRSDASLVGLFYAERNREFPLRTPVVRVGRGPDNAIRIPDPRIAGRHVRFLREDRGFTVEALDPDAVTTLNGDSIASGDRHALSHGDVVSLSGLGFRFAVDGQVRILAWLEVVVGVHRGKRFRLVRPDVRVGRGPDTQIQFPDRTVSRRHCRIFWKDGGWWIDDVGSRNGTVLNGAMVSEPSLMTEGDLVWLGDSAFRFRPQPARAPTASA